jgi:soluble lytic murein transglycosylase-like protein
MRFRDFIGRRAVRRASVAFAVLCGVLPCVPPVQPAPGATRAAAIGKPYQLLIERTAERHQLDPLLLEALVEVESGRNAEAVSPKGARGLGQLMPATARRFDVSDVHDPEDNLDGAARYLAWLIDRYQGDLTLALAAYNAGEGAVDRHLGVPPYPETRAYVRKVLGRAGLKARTGHPRGPDPVRLLRQADGTVLITNLK